MSIYEKGYVRWFIKSNARHLLVLCSILAMIPLVSYLATISFHADQYRHLPFVFSLLAYVGASVILAFGMPIYQFRYLMQKRACDLYYAMPITKGRFFLLQFVLGALCVLILPAIAYVVALFMNASYYVYFPYMLFMILPCGCLCFAFYSIVTYITLKCNNLWDACIVNLGYLVAPLMLYMGVVSIAQSTIHACLLSTNGSAQEILAGEVFLSLLSIPASLIYFCSGMSQAVYDNGVMEDSVWNVFLHAEGIDFLYILYWFLLGILLVCLAYRVYKKRPQEHSEQRTNAKQCYPALIVIVTISLLFVSNESYNGIANLSIINIGIILILFWTMVCFAKRKIQFTKGMVLSFLGMCALAYSLVVVFVSSNGFGRIQELPEISEVTSVNVGIYAFQDDLKLSENMELSKAYQGIPIGNLYMRNVMDPTVIQEVYDKQKEIIEATEQGLSSTDDYQGEMYITYLREDGSEISRSYYVTDSYLQGMMSMLDGWFTEGYLDEALNSAKMQYEQSLLSNG